MWVRERWAAGHPEFLVLTGATVGFAGTYALLVWTIFATPPSAWWPSAGMAAIGIGLCVVIPVLLARRKSRTARHFAMLGLLASILALLNYPGILGGGIALAGASWGMFTAYRPR